VGGGFSAGWLSMREPYDQAARNGAVLDAVAAAFAGASAATVTDLGCGTGATMRAMASRLPARQSWRLVDNDDVLLDVAATAAPAGASVTIVVLDLVGAIEQALDSCDLVATSALLDLVSAAWLDRLVASLARFARPFYAALSYDGAVTLMPETRHDAVVIAAVNRHQRTDKGFGPALGPDAARTAPARFRHAGFAVLEGCSDWRFGAGDHEIQMAMLDGWADAAREIGVNLSTLDEWLGERRDHVIAGRSHMRVGHIDFFAMPTGRR
jgi:methyltransferase family protein